jgi:hypothetical protein
MIRVEIEADNPFSGYSSFQSYKAKNRKKPTEKRPPKRELTESLKNLYDKIHKTIERNREYPF